MHNEIEKLLIFDGIGGVPLGREMYEAFCAQVVDAAYYDCAKLNKIDFYGARSGFAKLVNRAEKADIFYHLPRLDLEAFKKIIAKEKPSHLLVIGFIYKFVSPEVLKQLSADYNFKLFLYDTDSCNLYTKRREFVFFIENELPIYDEIFSFSQVTTRFFRETKKLKATFLPFGAKPLNLHPNITPQHDVLFVGSCDLRRIFLLEHIKDHVTIYGNRWTRNYPLISHDLKQKIHDQSVWGEALHRTLQDAKIILNITRGPFYGAETGVNLRIFEALAAGCFLLTDYCEELEELFVVGEEIEVFRSASELAEKVDYYLKHPARRIDIAKRGYEKFSQKHTWINRINVLIERLGST